MAYFAQSDMEAIYGTYNIATWGNFTPNATSTDSTRISTCIAQVGASIDAYMAQGPYQVPLVSSADGTSTPIIIVQYAAYLGGYWLWDTRNLNKVKEEVAEMKRKRDYAMQGLMQIIHGRMQIPAILRGTGRNIPLTSSCGPTPYRNWNG